MATVKKIKKAQSGAKAPVKKGASGPGVTGIRKAVYKEAANQFGEGTDIQWSVNKMQDWKKDVAKKPNYKKGGIIKKAKAGKQMIKRADGSTSQRGLWDNLRAAKGSGKKPTAQMLKQEKKIKAKTKK
jgi:hypothetical protein